MRKKVKLFTLLLISGLFSFSCTKRTDSIQVSLHQIQVPVLKFKQDNPVLQINLFVSPEASSNQVTSLTVNTEGTDDLKDIRTVRLFYLGGDSLWTRNSEPVQFGTDMKPSESIYFEGEQTLEGGRNYFWLSYELSEGANLHHRVDAGCAEIDFSEHPRLKPENINPPVSQRIGVSVRQHKEDGVHTYRIPGITTTNQGTLLAIYDARRESGRDLQGHIDIGLSRSTDKGNTWEPMRIPLDMDEWGGLPQKFNGVSDACILVDRNSDNIFVAGLWMHGVLDTTGRWMEGLTEESDAWEHQWKNKGSQPGFAPRRTSQFLLTKSIDDGQTWGEPVNLTTMCKDEAWWLWAPAPGSGITLEDGTLVFPTQGRDANGRPFSNITYSTDMGLNWKTSNAASHNTTECAVVQLSDGSLMLNIRDNRNRTVDIGENGRSIYISRDMGDSWVKHPSSNKALKEPVCMASLHKHVYTEDGETKTILLFSNPNITERPRRRTTIKVSFDDGNTWPEKFWLLLDEGNNRGYSCLTSVDENTIGILYEGSQAHMTFESIPLEELLNF